MAQRIFDTSCNDDWITTPDHLLIDPGVFDELLERANWVFTGFPDVDEVVYRRWEPDYDLADEIDIYDEADDGVEVLAEIDGFNFKAYSGDVNWVFSKVEVSRPHATGQQIRLCWYAKHTGIDMWADVYLEPADAKA